MAAIDKLYGVFPRERCDRITGLIAAYFGTTQVFINLYRHQWECFSGSETFPAAARPSPHFCQQVLEQQTPFAAAHEQQAYFGVPLTLPSGERLGALCLIVDGAVSLSSQQQAQLQDFAALIVSEIMLTLSQVEYEATLKSRQLSQVIANLQAEFILEENRRQAFDKVLSEVIRLMSCEYGFIGEVLFDERQQPYLKTYAITNIAWDQASTEFYEAHAQTGLEFRNLNTLFGHTLKYGEVVLTNTPLEHPASGGIPTGHPAMHSYLGVPIFFGQKMVAMLGLANKLGGFVTHDIDFLQPLLSTFGQLVYASQLRVAQQRTQSELNNIIQASGVGTWSLNVGTQQLELNERWFSMLGFTRDELPPIDLAWIHQRIHPDDLGEVQNQLSVQLEGEGITYEAEFRIRHKRGHWVWIQARGQLLKGHPSDPHKIDILYGINIDISRQKELEWNLSRLAAHIPGLVYQLQRRRDGSLAFTFAGAASLKILGYTPEELYQNGELAFSRVHPDDLGMLMRSMAVAEKQQQTWKCVFRLSVDGQHYRWLSGHASPEPLDSDTTIWHGYIQDVSEEMALQRELEQAKDVAEQSVALKARFLANMSHEIRTPMNGIIGLIDLIEDSNQDSEQEEHISLLKESAYSLLTIIDDILDFSKLEAGKLELSNEAHAITAVVDQAVLLMDLLASKHEVEIYYYCDKALSRNAFIDGERLRQVLINLISNAIKFSSKTERKGVVQVSAKLLDRQDEEGLVEITISDNGIGMPAYQVSELFQPFTQADPSTSRKYGGTGLGLAISQQIVQLMGGVIRAESELYQGSTFTLSLPVQMSATCLHEAPKLRQTTVVLVGHSHSVELGYLSLYLLDEDAKVLWHSPQHTLPALLPTISSPRVVYVIDLRDTGQNTSPLLDTLRSHPHAKQGVLLLGRGKRRKPRAVAQHIVHLDANALQRDVFIDAVQLAIDAQETTPKPIKARARQVSSTGKRILVLEDNTTNQLVIKQQLSRLGYEVDVADNGAVGFQMATTQHYDLILSDLHMPEMDGIDFTIAYRDFEQAQARIPVPIIALTANIVQQELAYCKQVGMNDYLIKPLPLNLLQTRITHWLQQRHHQPSQSALEHTLHAADATSATMIINLSQVADMVGEENVQEIIQDYMASVTTTLRILSQALTEQDSERIARESHKLKSSSRFVGANKLAQAFASLEQLASEATPASMAAMLELYQTLEEYYLQLATEIQRLFSPSPDKGDNT